MVNMNEIDWTGVGEQLEPIDDLTAERFVQRLNSLTDAVRALNKLRTAFIAQNPLCLWIF